MVPLQQVVTATPILPHHSSGLRNWHQAAVPSMSVVTPRRYTIPALGIIRLQIEPKVVQMALLLRFWSMVKLDLHAKTASEYHRY